MPTPFVYILVAALLAAALGIAPELQTFDGAACRTKDMTFTNCPKGQGDLLSQKCVGISTSSATKGKGDTAYLKMTSKDPATFEVYATKDMTCSGKVQATYKVNNAESPNLLGGKCAEGTWASEGKSEKQSMKLMACRGPYVPKSGGGKNATSGLDGGKMPGGVGVIQTLGGKKTPLGSACDAACVEKMKKRNQETNAQKLKDVGARDALAACKMAGKTGCGEKFRSALGQKSEKAMSAAEKGKAAAQDKFEAARGAKKAIAGAMASCNGTAAQCRKEAQTNMQNLKGRNFTNAEVAGELRAAGASAAGKSIKACIAGAADGAAKTACMNGKAARDAFAKASGRDAKDIKDVDLKKAARMQATTDLKDTLDACVQTATDASAKRACRMSGDMKQGIAAVMNIDAKNVKDSKVREYVAKAAQQDLLTAISSCDKKNVAKCKEVMRDIKAKAMGKSAASVTDDDLEMDKRQAMRGDLADKMTACVDDAAKDKKKIAECRTSLAKATLKNGDIEGKEPSRAKIEKALRDAGKNTAKNAMKDCGDADRQKCMTLSRERIAKTMGYDDASKVSKKMAEKLNKEGALEEVSQSAISCMQAKNDNASSSCDDLYDKYLSARKQSKPKNAGEAKTQKGRVMMSAVGAQMKNVREVCFDKKSKSDADKCLQRFQNETDNLASSVLTGSAEKMKAKKKFAKSKATTDYLGDRFMACMRAAANNTGRAACKTDLEAKRVVSGVKEKKEHVLRRYSAKALAEAASLCGSSDRAACKASAKADFIKTSGMKKRQYNAVKKMGEITSAAEVYAACLQENQTTASCDTQAEAEFIKVSGGNSKAWAAIKAKITKLGQGINDGVDLVMKSKKQVSVDAHTDSANCSDAAAARLLAMVKGANMTKAHSGVKLKGCRVIDGQAEYSVLVGTKNFTDAEVEAAADKLSSAITNATVSRRLVADSRFLSEARRLVSVSSAYAAQDTELCASTDTTCGVTEKDLAGEGDGATTAGATSTTATSTTASSVGTASSAMRQVVGSVAVVAMFAQIAWP